MDPQILTAAFLCGYGIYRIGLPPLVGFLLAGFLLNLSGYETTPTIVTLSDLGVTLLLFTIGLKLNLRSLIRPEIWASATLHMGFTVAIYGFILFLFSTFSLPFFLGLDLLTSLLLAFGLSFSSTVFAIKALEDNGRMDSLNGRVAIGVLIVQDLIAVVFLTFTSGILPSLWAIVLIAALPLARKLFFILLDKVGHGELQVLFGIFLALSAGAATFDLVGLKPDLGALILGALISSHPKAKELANALLNIKDLLLVGFFVNIGLSGFPPLSGIFAAFVLVIILPLKLFLYFFLFSRFKLKSRTSFLSTLNLSNYSEFGLIVCAMAVNTGLLDNRWLVVMAISLSFSFIVSSLLHKYSDPLFSSLSSFLLRFETSKRHPEEIPYDTGNWQIAIVGMGRIGCGAYDFFHHKFGDVIIGVDYDSDTVTQQIQVGRKVIQGDVTDDDFYQRIPKEGVGPKLIVIATSNQKANVFATRKLRKLLYGGSIASIAKHDDELDELLAAGANTAFNMYGEAGAGLATHVCDAFDGSISQVLHLPKG